MPRLGGDEFAILIEHSPAPTAGAGCRSGWMRRWRTRSSWSGNEVQVNVSIGVAVATRAVTPPTTCSGNADVAMYAAKRRGKGRSETYEPACTPTSGSG